MRYVCVYTHIFYMYIDMNMYVYMYINKYIYILVYKGFYPISQTWYKGRP